jgi:selenocysteine lyase/cysteine desulfurase
MTSGGQNRRAFLGAVTAGATGGLLAKTAFASDICGPRTSVQPSASEYLFADGITYLNTGTIGPCRRETIEASLKYWDDLESYPVKFYGGFGAEALAEKTRTVAARFLACALDEVVITNSTTSGMNAVAQGLRLAAGDRILITDQEHSGGLHCWKYFEKYYGAKIDTVAIPRGEFNAAAIVEKFRNAIDKKTKLVSVSHVFSSTGLRMPVAEISALARANGAFCIVDGAQSAGGIKVNVKELGCHAFATSGHKWLMGPKGTGLLYISKEAQVSIRPIQFDESYKTYNNGNGVVNLPCILGLAKAVEHLESVGIGKVKEHNLSLRNRLYNKLQNAPNLTIVSPPPGPLASPMLTLLLADKFKRQAFVKMLLDKHKIAIRPTHPEFGFNGVRFSMHFFNTEKEIDRAAEILHKELAA